MPIHLGTNPRNHVKHYLRTTVSRSLEDFYYYEVRNLTFVPSYLYYMSPYYVIKISQYPIFFKGLPEKINLIPRLSVLIKKTSLKHTWRVFEIDRHDNCHFLIKTVGGAADTSRKKNGWSGVRTHECIAHANDRTHSCEDSFSS